jgi:hypothetical protein
MRNLHLEAAIWNLFTSIEFFEAAAQECEDTLGWFGTLAIAREAANFGRNNQIFDTVNALARNFRRGAGLAKLGDYKLIWDTARRVSGDVRGMMEQPLHGWMTKTEYKEFEEVRIGRLMSYAGMITLALNNGMVKGRSFFHPNPDCPERSNDDDGFPGGAIVEWYDDHISYFNQPLSCELANPLPEYVIDRTVSCQTGDEVPWTGVWYPATGLEKHSLTFAVKGVRMQPAFRIIKTVEELERESDDAIITSPETVAVATTWHPLIPSGRPVDTNQELQAKAGEPCPKAGIWQPMEPGATQRIYAKNDVMANLGSAYGLTVWRWIADR